MYKGPSTTLNEQHSVYAAVVLRVVGALGVFPPHHLPPLRHKTQFADVDFDHCPLGDHLRKEGFYTGCVQGHVSNKVYDCKIALKIYNCRIGFRNSKRVLYRQTEIYFIKIIFSFIKVWVIFKKNSTQCYF